MSHQPFLHNKIPEIARVHLQQLPCSIALLAKAATRSSELLLPTHAWGTVEICCLDQSEEWKDEDEDPKSHDKDEES